MSDDSVKSTAYDGRLEFLAVLRGVMKTKAMAVVDGDHYLQERLLRQMIYMMRAFIKPSEYDAMIVELDKARKYIHANDSRFSPFVDKYLDKVDSIIYQKTAHVLLPVSTDEAQEDIDWEQFMKESDL